MGCRNATEPVLASAHLLFVTEDFAVFECDTGYAFLSQTEGISWCEDGAWTEPTGHCQQLPTSRDTTRWTTEATLTSQPNLDTTWWTTNATVTSQPNLDTTWWTTKATVTSQPNPDTTSDAHDPAFLTGDAAAYYISVAIGGLILLVIVLSIVFSQRRARAVRRRKSRLLQGSGEDGASTTKASELAVYSAPPYGAQDEETLDSRHPMEVMRRQQHFDSTLDSRRSDKSNYVTVIKIPSFSEYPSGSTMPRLGDPAFKSENREGSVYGYVSPLSAQKTTDPPQRQGRPDPGMSRRPPAPPPEEAGAVPYPQPYDITASALNMTDEGVYDQIPSLSGGNKLYIGHAPAANTAAVSLSRPWGDHQASGAQQNNAL